MLIYTCKCKCVVDVKPTEQIFCESKKFTIKQSLCLLSEHFVRYKLNCFLFPVRITLQCFFNRTFSIAELNMKLIILSLVALMDILVRFSFSSMSSMNQPKGRVQLRILFNSHASFLLVDTSKLFPATISL